MSMGDLRLHFGLRQVRRLIHWRFADRGLLEPVEKDRHLEVKQIIEIQENISIVRAQRLGASTE